MMMPRTLFTGARTPVSVRTTTLELADKTVGAPDRGRFISRFTACFKLADITLATAIFVGIAGCATISAPPPPPAGAAATTSPEEFDAARKLYVNQCGRCHKFYNPNKYSATDWNLWMRKMAKKSKLTVEQEEMLARHLELYRSEK